MIRRVDPGQRSLGRFFADEIAAPLGLEFYIGLPDSVDQDHLNAWVADRKGIEGFVEPRTAVSDVTLLLVAHDGEWTRRRVPSVDWAHKFCNRFQVPSYDAAVVGIPQRMRDYNRRKKLEG